ncbi:hypothetical protein IACHDJAJ_00015 [Aeromonas phage vB_AdhS_TS3]|nr:hypothetical protein IACHDJAJ_00015 [Aeromonas phage vB_AdhS_TS3]
MQLLPFVDIMGDARQAGFWQLKAQARLKTGIMVSVYWCQWDGCIAAVETNTDGDVISHYIRTDEVVTPDYVAIKNYVWTDQEGPWLYVPSV